LRTQKDASVASQGRFGASERAIDKAMVPKKLKLVPHIIKS
jgi:hypothetical protein